MKTFFYLLCFLVSTSIATAEGQVYQYLPREIEAIGNCFVWNAEAMPNQGTGGIALQTVHPATNGWSLPLCTSQFVDFSGGDCTPFAFPDTATNTVSFVFSIVSCSQALSYSTLLDAPCSVRFDSVSLEDKAFRFCTEQLSESVSIELPGREDPGFPLSEVPQIVEATFSSPVPLREIFLGNAPASPLWQQSWNGRIYEWILFEEVPTETQKQALRKYAFIRHALQTPVPAVPALQETLSDLGVNTEGMFQLLFSVY